MGLRCIVLILVSSFCLQAASCDDGANVITCTTRYKLQGEYLEDWFLHESAAIDKEPSFPLNCIYGVIQGAFYKGGEVSKYESAIELAMFVCGCLPNGTMLTCMPEVECIDYVTSREKLCTAISNKIASEYFETAEEYMESEDYQRFRDCL